MITRNKSPSKKQRSQQQRLSHNIRNTKRNKAELNKAVSRRPSGKKGGFFASIAEKLFGITPETAQQSIPYIEMYRDGICRVTERYYTKTIRYFDINYQLARNEDKTQIFEGYCDFLNYFDSSIAIQMSFINQYGNKRDIRNQVRIKRRRDKLNAVRTEYSGFICDQLSKGNNGLVKAKYITFGIEADNLKAAKPRLERVEADIINNFKVLGVKSESLNGKERLALLHSQFRPFDGEKLVFDWNDIVQTGNSTKDFIAPDSFGFKDYRTFTIGNVIGAASFVQIQASELTDSMLKDLLDMDTAVTVTIHIRSIDQNEAIKNIKRIQSDIDRMKIEENKKAVRSGYDMDIIPSDLVTYGEEAKNLLQDLQNRNERLFEITILIINVAKNNNRQRLENDIYATAGILRGKYNCALRRLDYQQEQGLMSSLALGLNQIEIQRGLTTSSTAIFVPFTTQELFMDGDDAVYYGLNALSNNIIRADRKRLSSPNGLILGMPGSGKSFAAKLEIVHILLTMPRDNIIVTDPEGEYCPLVKHFGGEVIKLSFNSHTYINPMDINLDTDEEPLKLKSNFIMSLCELIIGGKDGLQPIEMSIIDRAVQDSYREYAANPTPENMPILEDVYNNLLKQSPQDVAQRIAAALSLYVTGSLNLFNHRTNIDIGNRFVCFDIKELGSQLKKIGMLILQEQVWSRVTANRKAGVSTWYYVDEFVRQEATYSVAC